MQQRLRSGFRAAYQSITAPSRRAWLGSVIALVLLLVLWTPISGWYRGVLIADKRSEIAASLAHDGNALVAAIDHRAVALQSLTAYILFHQTEANLPQETEADMILETQFASKWLQQNLTGIDYVAVAPDGRQRYVFPLTGNEDQLDLDLLKQPAPELRQVVERAIVTRGVVIGSLDRTASAPARLTAYYAVFKDDKFWGLITLGLDFQRIVEDARLGQVEAGMEVALRDDVGRTLYGAEAVFDMAPVTQRLSGLEADWILAGVPASGWDASIQDAFLPFQAAGVSVISLLTVLVFLAMSQQSRLSLMVQQRTEALRQAQGDLERRVQLRTAELTQANDELKAEMSVRKRVARQLRESETLYRTLVTASPDAVIVANRRGRVTFASAAALRMFGYDYPEDMLGVSVLRGITKPDRARARDRVQCLSEGHPLPDNDEFVLRDKTGRQFVGEISLACLYTDDGAANGFVSIVRDVTHRVEMQEALRRAHDELELRVQERTRQLARANAGLQAEIAERRLAEQQVQLQTTAMEAAANGIMITDRDGVIEWCNSALVQMTGYSVEEIIGRTPRLFQSGRHGHQFYAQLWSTVLAGRTWSGEIVNRRKDGTEYTEGQTITPVLGEGGEVTHIIAIKQDITGRRRAEDVLRQSELRFRTVANFTYDWEYWEGPDRTLIFMSPSCERTTGYMAADFVNDPTLLQTIIHPDDRALMVDHVHSPTDSGDLTPIDFRILRRDGTLRWIAHVCRPVFDEQGGALGRRISNRDITERKAAEESLREQEKLYRSIFQTTADGLAISTLEGRIVEANPAFCEMHGFTESEVIGQRLLTFIHPTHRHWFAASVRAVRAGEPYETQAVHLRKDDHPFHVEAQAVGLTYYGRPHILSVVRDVSAQVGAYMRLEERVRERTHELGMLLEFSHSMTRTLEKAPLLRLILNQLRAVVDYTGAAILSLSGQDLVYVANQGPTPEEICRRLHLPVESPLARAVIGRLRPVIIADVQGDSPLARAFQVSVGESLDTAYAYVRSWLGVPLIITDRAVGMLAISHAQPNYFTQRHADLALAFANQATMAMENARLYEQAQDLAALQERQRLARDLHDSVSQTLFSASLAAQVLPRLWERDREEGQQCLNELSRLTRGALAEMRTLLVELRPNVLVETKLGDLLRQLAEAIISRTRVPVQVVAEGHAPLPPDVQVALYRIAQEALNNIAKHANADQAIVSLHYYPTEQPPDGELDNDSLVRVELSVSDDGRGFSQVGISADHLGLGIMRERAEAIDAALTVDSQIGSGTQVVVRWPQRTEGDHA